MVFKEGKKRILLDAEVSEVKMVLCEELAGRTEAADLFDGRG